MVAVAKDAGSVDDRAAVLWEMVQALASAAPRQAVIDAWGLLEYQLNVASDRFAPDQPHGWPQVALNLETWDEWPRLCPALMELWRLREYTVVASRPPLNVDAARYVSVAQDRATSVRASLMSHSSDISASQRMSDVTENESK